TIPADLEAPYIVNTTPTENETMKYTLRPVVRIEYNEELDWNEDQAVDAIVVVDADGNTYDGTLTHTVIRNASVLHYYLNQNIARDKCFKVTVKGGFADLSGNVSEPKTFKFLSEYRTEKSNVEMIGEYVAADWFASIAGSGSSKGFTDPENQFYAKSSLTYSSDVPSSMQIHYQYDPETSEAYWGGRAYNRKTDGGSYYSNSTGKNAVIQAMVYGDGSEQFVGHGIRWRNDEGSVKRHTTQPMVRGWNMVAWDVNNEECSIVSGTQTMVTDGQWKYDAFWIWKGYVDQLTEENEDMLDYPAEYWEGDVYLGPVHKVIYNDEEQTASLSDIPDDVTVKLGDVNDDGEINVLDVTVLINYILNKNPQPFNIANANVNQSGEIDVLDVTALINIILSGN
ncbi:MAG: dockerin type I repeat-containing protein, partial [Muribaculaceae bacterium]|nr:dockerin type I repeat-containing protein [Muribaculaceae bacterium]